MEALAIDIAEFNRFRVLMREAAGIDLPQSKMSLVSGRLAKRLREHGLRSFGEYYRLVTSDGNEQELGRVIDLLTTHETYFFREPAHFSYLAEHVLPTLPAQREFRAWSAACSTGEEAYSLAMVLMEGLGESARWEVLASDISDGVLAQAQAAVYPMQRIEGIRKEYLHRYCLRGVGQRHNTLKIDAPLRQRVRFARINLNAALSGFGQFDVIFLRNVMIYFDAPTKRDIVERLARQLKPGGRLFIGHSESLNGVTTALQQERPTIYRRS